MQTLKITVYQNGVQVLGALNNFVAHEEDWDLGMPFGMGSTIEKAIDDFKESYMLKYDEEIEVEIIKTVIR